jgi:cell volume regulation protein A
VLTSVLIQGSTIPIMARWLKVDAPLRARRRAPLEMDYIEGMDGELFELELPHDSPAAGRRLFELKLPAGVLLALIGRDTTYLIPSGGTELEGGDILYLLADQETLAQVRERLELV